MKKNYLFTFLLLMVINTFLFAQEGTISGTVKNKNGEPLSYVNVGLEGTSKGTTTTKTGAFQIHKVAQGQYSLAFSMIGYESQKIDIQVVAGETTEVAPIVLTEKEEELAEVIVSDTKAKYVESNVSPSLRQKTEVFKLPQNIQIVGSQLMVDQQVTNIMEGAIRNVSGVTMLEHWGHFARINMRGFRLPALRNGFNVSDAWGPLSEDMSFVDRMEFVKGPAGFMLAAGEPGGFYNVVTKKPVEKPLAQVAVTAGSFDFYRAEADFGGAITENKKLLFRLNGMYQTSDSHRGGEDAKRFMISPALTYNLSEKTSITGELNYQQAESYIGAAYVFGPVSSGYGSVDKNFKMVDTNYPATDIKELTLFADLNHKFNNNWEATLRFSHLKFDQEGNSHWLASMEENGDAIRYANIWDALSVGNYAQGFIQGKANTGNISHSILGGIDYTDKEYWSDWSQNVPYTTPFNIFNPTYGYPAPEFDRSVDLKDRSTSPYDGYITTAYYLQDEIGFLNDKLRLTLAGRYTHVNSKWKEEDDSRFTPRVGVSVNILEDLTAYALYDQSFIPQGGASFDGKPFDPEEAADIEGGLKKTFLDGKLRTSLGVYQITKQNILVGDPENPNFSKQLGEVQSKGFEFDLQGEITRGLNVVLNYANTDVKVTKDTDPENVGKRVAGHAKHVTNGWFTYSFSSQSALKGFGASLGYQYQIDRSTWAWNAENETDLPDYFRLDGGLFWGNEKLRVQFNINNLLNEYLYSGANYGTYLYWQSEPGINGRVRVTYNFK
ncbi:TonB-dependent siderophore receptor [Flexithrix dorotheae]|uniref:TonB-dependent siderophore receptor n=1 Tax=Flexithrix dorotheae TaxID=70993 RepID=UPI0003731495|nr:TonB-dependent siderophore receptor [Flexithrix dorotheae]